MSCKVEDHLGNEFHSVVEMCLYWGVNVACYRDRCLLGWSLEEALTIPEITRQLCCIDHLGNEFDSITSMCHAYSINPDLFKRRLYLGWPLKEALTRDVSEQSGICCVDHTGHVFDSISAMCRYWQIAPASFNHRLKNGWSLEDALTKVTNVDASERTDHLGREYPTIVDMCRAWGVDYSIYRSHRAGGWSLEDALTKTQAIDVAERTDHLGKEYRSVSVMCRAWDVAYAVYRKRRSLGWSLEKALTVHTVHTHIDPLGVEFNSERAMAEYWGLTKQAYRARVKTGKVLFEALASKPYKLPTASISTLPAILNSYNLVKSYINFDIEILSEKEFKYWDASLSLAFLTTECPMYLYVKDAAELLVVFSESRDCAEVFLHKPEEDAVHTCFITKEG